MNDLETADLSEYSENSKESPQKNPVGLDTEELPTIENQETLASHSDIAKVDINETIDFTLEISSASKSSDPNETIDITLNQTSFQQKVFKEQHQPFLLYTIEETEHRFPLEHAETYLGRAAKNDLCLEVKNLSRTHCKIFRIRKDWYLEDCGSFNGTFLNGHKLPANEKKKITKTSTIRIGDLELQFSFPVRRKNPFIETPFRKTLRFLPGFFISVCVHTLILYLFAQIILFIQNENEIKPIKITALKELLESDEEKEAEDFSVDKIFSESSIEEDLIDEIVPDDIKETEVEIEEVEVVPDFAPVDSEKPPLDFSPNSKSLIGLSGLPKGGKFGGRFGSGKKRLLKKFGGGKKTEAAVDLGLKWLAKHQDPMGYWDPGEFTNQCDTMIKCTDARRAGSHREAITAFSVLAFLGAGHTEQSGHYKKTVRKGIAYLKKQQLPDGSFGGKENNMYTHAIATLALCEALQFQRGSAVRTKHAKRGIDYILKAQNPGLGWRYRPQDSNDTSVTGWCIMALKAARDAKIRVPKEAFIGAKTWLDKATSDTYYRTGYTFPNSASHSMTAVGVASRFFLGASRKNPVINGGIGYLLEKLPSSPKENYYNQDYYYWYYGTMATFQYGGKPWLKWNQALKEALLPAQIKEGCEAGSWGAYCVWFGPAGGRTLNTAVAILILEIYYRYPQVFR